LRLTSRMRNRKLIPMILKSGKMIYRKAVKTKKARL
jgi:hypothetical protein